MLGLEAQGQLLNDWANPEIVPAQRPTLSAVRIPNALVLTWPGNFQLYSATNVTGPYLLVPGASSPWTNLFSAPRQFFILQSSP